MKYLSHNFRVDKEEAKKLRDFQFEYTQKNQNIKNFILNLKDIISIYE